MEAFLKITIEKKWHLFIAVTIAGVAFDWFTKYLAATHLRVGVPVNVIGHYAQFLLIFNKAAIWGIDPRTIIPWFPLNGFFYIFNIVAMAIIIVYYRTLKPSDKLMQWGLALIMPGALGNLFDRLVHAKTGVVDFIRLGISDRLYWAIFNCADIYVTFGVAIMLWYFLFVEKKQKAAATQPSPDISA
ncbi:MAG TPA: signal peptidase II [Chitinivibrionales bacterium]|nr:signal peptidase II [Chitinivibrionales bacterium]